MAYAARFACCKPSTRRRGTDPADGLPSQGDRIDLRRDEGGSRRYKLAWVSPGRRLFVLSRHPEESLSVDAADLAGWMADGRALRVAPEASLLDQALGVASMLR